MPAGLASTSGLRWVTLVLGATSLWLCWPLWPALVLAAWTASLLRPLMMRFERRLHGRRVGAAVLTSMVAVAVAAPLALVLMGAVMGARNLADVLATAPTAEGALERMAVGTPGSVSALRLPHTVNEGVALMRTYGREAFDLLSELAGAAIKALLMLVVYFAGTFVFMRQGAEQWEWFAHHLPLRREHLDRFACAFQETGRGLLLGVGLTSAAQGAVAMGGYFALGVPEAWVLGPLTGIASVIPLVGSTLIWGPVALGLLLTEHPIKAAVLVVLGVGVIGTMDNLLRPWFARLGTLQLPTLVLFVSAFGGLLVAGPWGALLGPLVVRLTVEALRIERYDDGAPARQPANRDQTPAPERERIDPGTP